MSYYRGDFYQGDFYRGDPFFGSLFGKLFSVGKGLLGFGGGGGAKMLPAGGATAGLAKYGGQIMSRVGGMVSKHPVLSAAGAAGTIGILGGAAGRGIMHPGAAQKGFHISKRTGKMVRNRRMRVTNVKALRRSIRRCQGFAHLAKRVLRFTSPRAPRGRAVFRHARRRTAKLRA